MSGTAINFPVRCCPSTQREGDGCAAVQECKQLHPFDGDLNQRLVGLKRMFFADVEWLHYGAQRYE
jgi:hypothetical protein